MKRLSLYTLSLFLFLQLTLTAQITSFPYVEDFDSDNGSWTTSGTNNSWEWGAPNNRFIAPNTICGNNAWVTDLNDTYSKNELSYLESPVFDLSAFGSDPVIRFNLIYNIFNGDDAHFEASTDGILWNKVTDAGSAINWYNNAGEDTWDDDSANWLTATNTLTGMAGESTVYLRFVFQSNNSFNREGIGVDYFILSEGAIDDLELTRIDSPVDACDLSDTENIEVSITNESTEVANGFQVCFQLDANAPVCENFVGNIAAFSSNSYTFAASIDLSTINHYTIKTYVIYGSDIVSCNDEITETIGHIASVPNLPYYEGFEVDEGDWKSIGEENTWAFGTPDKTTIKGASSGVNAWTTGGLSTGKHINGEQSYVISPCFDFSTIPNNYYIGADIWWFSEEDFTGTALQATTDNGATWITIGAAGDPLNWYNSTIIEGQPGGQSSGWTGTNASGSRSWTLSYHSIPASLIGAASVRFRYFLGSEYNVEATPNDGFAFDNFFIGLLPSIDVDYCTSPLIAEAGGGFNTYTWSSGESTQTISVATGTYTVTVTDQNSITASFSIEVSNIPLPNINITFGVAQNCGQAPLIATSGFKSYAWSNGTNTESILATQSINYVVTVTNEIGCTATANAGINVLSIPTTSISGNLQVCSTQNTILSTNSSYNNYLWSNGQTNRTINATVGIYTVTVSNFNNCTASASVEVSQLPTPSTTITGNLSICPNESTTLDAGTGFNSYNWSNGQTNQTITATAGIYTITISNANNCTATSSFEVIENAAPTTSITGNLSICPNENTTLDAGANFNSYNWSNGTTNQTITATTGIYTVTISNASNCTTTSSIEVIENPAPSTIITGNLSICPNENTTLDAGTNFNSYNWSNGQNSQTITATAGIYTVTISNANNCTATSSIEVIENPTPSTIITGNLSICPNENTTLDAGTNFNSYNWSNGQTNQTITAITGIYIVTISNANNCTATSSIEVIENPTPTTSITGNLSICPNESTTLDAGANFNSYTWSNGTTNQTITATTGIYTVTISNASNCTATSSIEVSLTLLPPPSITGDFVYCPSQTTILDAGDYDAYVWSNGTTNRLVAASEGVYTVTVTNGNCSATSSVEIVEGEGLSILDGSENFIPYIGPTGLDGFHFTVCGGELPFDYTYESENGFVSTTSFLSENNNCHIFEVFYVLGSEWTMTITAENACGEFIYTSEDVDLLYPQIHGFDMSPETCVGYEDGSITVDVVGGDTSCGDYTYIWSGPSGFTASTQTITGLASGLYEITIVDCNDKETAADTYLNRATGRGRGRSGCSGKVEFEAPAVMGKNSIGLYPNPFETSTTIQFSLEENDRVWLSVYGADGRKAMDLLKGTEVAANELQSLNFDAYGWRSGVYLLQLRTANGVFLYEKMVIGR